MVESLASELGMTSGPESVEADQFSQSIPFIAQEITNSQAQTVE